MLTAAKRRVLNIICIMMALTSLTYGLLLKYDKSPLEDVVVQEKSNDRTEQVMEPDIVLTSNNPFTNPDE